MKKQFTIKERHEHYKLVHRKTKNKEYHYNLGGFCDRSAFELYGDGLSFEKITKKMFPEFWLFKPQEHGCYWFKTDFAPDVEKQNAEEHRLVALEFCIAMTENGK